MRTGSGRRIRREEFECRAVFNDAIEDDGIWGRDAFMAGVRSRPGVVLELAGPFPNEAEAWKAAERIAKVLNSTPGDRPLEVRQVDRMEDYGPALRQLVIWGTLLLLTSVAALAT